MKFFALMIISFFVASCSEISDASQRSGITPDKEYCGGVDVILDDLREYSTKKVCSTDLNGIYVYDKTTSQEIAFVSRNGADWNVGLPGQVLRVKNQADVIGVISGRYPDQYEEVESTPVP